MNKISAAGTEELAKAFPVNTLVYVDIQGNPVGNAGALLKEGEAAAACEDDPSVSKKTSMNAVRS